MKWYSIFSLSFFVASSVFVLTVIQLGIEIMAGQWYTVATQFGLAASLLFLVVSTVVLPFSFLFFYLWKSWNEKSIAVLQQITPPPFFSFLSLLFSYVIPLLLSTFIVDVFIRNVQLKGGAGLNNNIAHLISIAVLAIFNIVYGRITRKTDQKPLAYDQSRS